MQIDFRQPNTMDTYEDYIMSEHDNEIEHSKTPQKDKNMDIQINDQDLVFVKNQQPVTTSLVVAKMFEKQHKDVIRAIRKRVRNYSKSFNRRNFAPVKYVDEKGENRPMYEITRDGFAVLAMGFTGKKAAQFHELFIEEFNRRGAIIARMNPKLPKAKYKHKFGYYQVDSSPDGYGKMRWVSGEKTLEDMNEVENHAWTQAKRLRGSLGNYRSFLADVPEDDRFKEAYSDLLEGLENLVSKFKPKNFGSRYMDILLFP